MDKILDLLTRISVLYDIPQWIVNIGALAIILFLIAVPFIAKKLMEPKYYKFREMGMYNVYWKWKYRKGDIVTLWCYCPTCHNMLTCDDENCRASAELQDKNTFFVCDVCGGNEQGRVVGGDRRYALSLVKREILRQIRSLDYIETMKKSKEISSDRKDEGKEALPEEEDRTKVLEEENTENTTVLNSEQSEKDEADKTSEESAVKHGI